MKLRKKISRKRSKKLIRKTSGFKSKNIRGASMRGGYRL